MTVKYNLHTIKAQKYHGKDPPFDIKNLQILSDPFFVAKIGIRTVHCYLQAALGVAEIKLQKLKMFSSS